MKRFPLRTALAAALLCTTVSVSAKTLVVCTEASPEGFDIVQFTTAVTADASAETILNRLVDFAPGTTDVEPALAERWDIVKRLGVDGVLMSPVLQGFSTLSMLARGAWLLVHEAARPFASLALFRQVIGKARQCGCATAAPVPIPARSASDRHG